MAIVSCRRRSIPGRADRSRSVEAAAHRMKARRARRGLRLRVQPTIVHADRRRRLRKSWQRALAEEVDLAWPR